MVDHKYLDRFESILSEGLLKIIRGAGLLPYLEFDEKLVASPDIDELWDKSLMKDYVADAVVNFNDYPEAAISFAAFLGMAVAHYWDEDWSTHSNDSYSNFYGDRKFDDIDEHILRDIIGFSLDSSEARKISDCFLSCAIACLGLIQHESIETQTEMGFYILSRCYTVLYRLGAAVELNRLGYRNIKV